MPRGPRLIVPEIALHIVQRGHDRRDCFLHETDYLVYPQACARLMRNLGQRYVQYFNRRYDRRGTLWEGRFKSCLVDSAEYVIAAHRYIESNPVRAGMVPAPEAYRWSSHAGNSGRAVNKLLTPHPEYSALGSDETSRHAAYRGLFLRDDETAFIEAIRDATNGGFALAGERLKAQLPPVLQPRLARRTPGPQPKAVPQTHKAPAELELELGLRPRRS